MIATQRQNHKIYASFSESGWTIINQGLPLCDYKHSYDDILKVAAIYKITLPEVIWHGDYGKWVFTSTIEEVAAWLQNTVKSGDFGLWLG